MIIKKLCSLVLAFLISFVDLFFPVSQKTAERLVLELRDKLMKQGIEAGDNTKVREAKKAKEENNEVKQEAFDALVNLGYKKQDAKTVIDKSYEDGMSLEQLIKKCLTR